MKVFRVKNVVLREGEAEKTKGQTHDVRESKKFWKTVRFLTLFLQNTHFSWLNWLANESPSELLKTLKPRFWKKFLSLFHDWTYTCQVVVSESRMPRVGKLKNQYFWKFWKFFWVYFAIETYTRQIVVSELWMPLVELATWAWFASESRKCRVADFWIFFVKIFKSKYFQKTTKILKIFLGLINRCLSMYIFNQVQSHKWIRHSLNIDMRDVGGYQLWDSP